MSNKLYLHLANSHFSTSSLVSIYGIHLSHPEILLFIITCLFRLLLKWFSTRYSSLHFYQILERLCDPPGNLVPNELHLQTVSVFFVDVDAILIAFVAKMTSLVRQIRAFWNFQLTPPLENLLHLWESHYQSCYNVFDVLQLVGTRTYTNNFAVRVI
jgi:uncharacterized protein YggT (Ycf19 family)